MDSDHFDALARSLSDASTRRTALGAALGGPYGILHIANADAKQRKRKKKCKKPCGPCKKCKKGKCKRKPTGSACGVGRECLANSSCAKTCMAPADCGPACPCSSSSVEGQRHCIQSISSCDLPSCASTAECAPGRHCQPTDCGLPPRCVPLCAA